MQSQINSRILQNKRTSITVQPSLQFLSAATQQNSRPNSNTPLTPQQLAQQFVQPSSNNLNIITPTSNQQLNALSSTLSKQVPKVLVADDQEYLVKFMVAMLERYKLQTINKFEILVAHDGKQAVDLYKLHMRDVRLILMDIQMPEMDGYEASKCIREIESENGVEPKCHIVALSGEAASPINQRKCKQNEINEQMVKPINRAQLEQLMHILN
ncbi:hypothetical protein FGO68_gene2354 [Halteria grandinella]|uniref:Response regulatory domain-containing protein n=1 Tax=Halteria grandinella TaxID=5974 RepID=A0A8J8NE61_HALGN|nr:hypothetical protein FGO68_gene2354 [Halteria grandinella]